MGRKMGIFRPPQGEESSHLSSSTPTSPRHHPHQRRAPKRLTGRGACPIPIIHTITSYCRSRKCGVVATILSISTLLTISVASAKQHSYSSTTSSSVLRNGSRQSRDATTNFPSSNQSRRDHDMSVVLQPEHLVVPIGGVVHLFPRYGYLSLSMRVIGKAEKVVNTTSSTVGNATSIGALPQHSSTITAGSPHTPQRVEQWIFLEPVNNVIDTTTLRIEESSMSPHENQSVPFHNLFHIDLCEDVSELLEAYFKNFSIEGLDKPWQAFSGGWRSPAIGRNFGIDQAFVDGDYRFILVKVLLVRGHGTVTPLENVSASEFYEPRFVRFQPNNDLSSYEFFKVVGTHYIHAYIVGNAVYQVFVYDPDGFQAVKRRLLLDGVKHQSTTNFMTQLPETMSSWVRQTGRIFVLNAAPDVSERVRAALVTTPSSSLAHPVTNLFKLHNNPDLVKEIEMLLADEPNGILGIDLRGIHILFKDPVQRSGFEKALKHKMQLWEINFQY